jgi:hypothetical protein
MSRQTGIWLLVVVFLLPALSCARLPEKPAQTGVMAGSEQLIALDSIPSAWGKLTSATSNPAFPGWFQLWFEDETGTVRMAAFNFQTRQFDSNVMVLPRK